MGVFEGTITYRRYFVAEDLPPGFKDTFVPLVKHHMFEELSPDSDVEDSIGWVCIENLLDTQMNRSKLFYNEYCNLGLRQDRWSIPPTLIKARLKQRIIDNLKETKRKRLSRPEQAEVKKVVTAELKRKVLPSPRVFDMSWNTATGVVRFWSTNRKICEVFEELFEKTFEITLTADSAYVSGLQAGLEDEQLELLPELEPCALIEDFDADGLPVEVDPPSEILQVTPEPVSDIIPAPEPTETLPTEDDVIEIGNTETPEEVIPPEPEPDLTEEKLELSEAVPENLTEEVITPADDTPSTQE